MSGVQATGVSKGYGATRALQGLTLHLAPGSITGIAGANGAGKSTFTRILAGEERCDAGEFLLDGRTWSPFDEPGRVAVVHQEPQVWPNLTVLDNLRVGREGSRYTLRSEVVAEEETLARLQLSGLRNTLLEECTLAVQQRVEIARAMLADARCFIFDEPNSALTDEESRALFAFMHHLADSGHVVVIISHRLGDLVAHCRRVVIIRDGIVASELSGPDLTEPAIAAELVVDAMRENEGVSIAGPASGSTDRDPGRPEEPEGVDVIRVSGWSSPSGAFTDIDLAFRSGEVTAMIGAEGSGARELAASLAGFATGVGKLDIQRDRRSTGSQTISYLPPDRKQMLFHNFTVGQNLVARLRRGAVASRWGTIRPTRVRTIALEAIRRFGIKTKSPDQLITDLSGGNQQKVAISAALVSEPAALVIIEPTRGVDVASKRGIYATLRSAAQSGLCVVVFCTEVPEAFEVGDRVVVVHRGRKVLDARSHDFADVTALAIEVAAATVESDGSDGAESFEQKEKGNQ